ncbi:MAG: hypothetical protein LUQ04_10450 [Methanoregula sp.]|nr:hypothetical protein [Methanoregula sp.]
MSRLFIISNRLPVTVRRQMNTLYLEPGVGGPATAPGEYTKSVRRSGWGGR